MVLQQTRGWVGALPALRFISAATEMEHLQLCNRMWCLLLLSKL